MHEEDRSLFPGAIEMMVLQVLRSGPLHGYVLCQIIKRHSDDLLEIEEGSLYPALQRMLRATAACARTASPPPAVGNWSTRYRPSIA
jgi:DNA-binding PadR family transcriptional regulator